jgi:putative ABC transport system permease protein
MHGSGLRVLLSRVLEIVRRRRRDTRLAAEIAQHLDELIAQHVARGVSPAEARRLAQRDFGGVDRLMSEHRELRGLPFLDACVIDTGFAIRLLLKGGWLTLGAVLILALGLGVNTAVFTIINGMHLRGLPVAAADRIMRLDEVELEGRRRGLAVAYADFRDWRAATRTFRDLAAYAPATMTVGDRDRSSERLAGWLVSAQAFRLLGISPVLGRDFEPADDRAGAASVVLLAHHVWVSRYDADPGVIGRAIRVNGSDATVIGVMPAGFQFPIQADLWQPIGAAATIARDRRTERQVSVFGRLQDEATPDQARAELSNVAQALATRHPDSNAGIGVRIQPFADAYVGSATEGPPVVITIAAVLLLLVVCANVANMLLGHAAGRGREMAVRAALGASRARLVRQLLVESVLLSAVAGAAGMMLAVIAMRFFAAEAADLNLPYWIRFDFDPRVFAFAATLCLGTAMLVGLTPAWQLSRRQAPDALTDGGRVAAGGRRSRRWVSALLTGEVALTLILLTAAGLLVRSGRALERADAPVASADLLTALIDVPVGIASTLDERRALDARLEEQLAADSSIASATLASARPFVGAAGMQAMLDGDEAPRAGERVVQMVAIGERYFETLALPLVRGRVFDRTDGLPGRDVVIINERFASLHFPGVDPIGRRLRLADLTADAEPGRWLTIVGVSPSIRQRPMGRAAAVAYVPLRSQRSPSTSVIVRSAGDPALAASALRDALRRTDPDLAAYNLLPLARLSQKSRWGHRIMSVVLALLATIATLVSAAGLYAITAHGVVSRTAEIGVRLALGAQRGQVAWLFLRRTFTHVAVGLALGLAGAFAAGQLIQSLLVETSPAEPLTFIGVAAAMTLVAVAACLVPVRRAMGLDPVAALRRE